MAIVTILITALVAVYAPGTLKRLPILLGGVLGYLAYFIGANLFGYGKAIDFTTVSQAQWIGLPNFTTPVFQPNAMFLIAPVAIILVAENLGHVKAVAAMTGTNLDKYLGRAFLGDAVSTIISGFGGGTGVTTYAENIGVMAVTRIYSSLLFVFAALIALLLGFCPKFGALIRTIPTGVLGGLAVVLFGLIAVTGARIWVQDRVDFSRSRNLIPAAVALTIGAGNFQIIIGKFTLSAIGVATLAVIVLYQILREKETPAVETAPEG